MLPRLCGPVDADRADTAADNPPMCGLVPHWRRPGCDANCHMSKFSDSHANRFTFAAGGRPRNRQARAKREGSKPSHNDEVEPA
jgi:hypothetical protein